ncbi:hypothetical protein QBC47DRAFT_320753, partial [Echria macrotheca]
MPSTTTDPDYARIVRYQHDLPDRSKLTKAWALLQNYSGIPEDEIEPHVRNIRDKAFAIFNYPCLGRFRFLDLYITTHPEYPSLLSRLSTGKEKLLDAGCCVGQVPRQLIYDGVPPSSVAAFDLRREFIDLGYDLFRDRDSPSFSPVKFVTGDILDPDSEGLRELDGQFDIIHAAAFFHLFGWDDQVAIGERFVKFFRPGVERPTVLGRQVGTERPISVEEWREKGGGKRYHHDRGSMQRLWDVVGERTGTRWRVEAEL